ncbi:Dabb family protein [Acidisoma cellulosilytica]|uniref:Dabb family protein n=1 Tax=Acidisoma cellulosilyticum TaxID=2802395 RepID=A0A963Z647_9PROT|nr:Dabb family protein [Acidisoma cellulosilyticum]MCB8883564.1 Dabb family protein [Acidisoma cellulosilyticum]
MIKHIVMWNLLGDSPEEKLSAAMQVKTGFEGLIGQIPGLMHLEVGIDISRVSYACDMVLYSEFTDGDALASYANHPAHLDVRDRIAGLRIARYQVDYPAPSDSPYQSASDFR